MCVCYSHLGWQTRWKSRSVRGCFRPKRGAQPPRPQHHHRQLNTARSSRRMLGLLRCKLFLTWKKNKQTIFELEHHESLSLSITSTTPHTHTHIYIYLYTFSIPQTHCSTGKTPESSAPSAADSLARSRNWPRPAAAGSWAHPLPSPRTWRPGTGRSEPQGESHLQGRSLQTKNVHACVKIWVCCIITLLSSHQYHHPIIPSSSHHPPIIIPSFTTTITSSSTRIIVNIDTSHTCQKMYDSPQSVNRSK